MLSCYCFGSKRTAKRVGRSIGSGGIQQRHRRQSPNSQKEPWNDVPTLTPSFSNSLIAKSSVSCSQCRNSKERRRLALPDRAYLTTPVSEAGTVRSSSFVASSFGTATLTSPAVE